MAKLFAKKEERKIAKNAGKLRIDLEKRRESIPPAMEEDRNTSDGRRE